jgi:hypothetical protein
MITIKDIPVLVNEEEQIIKEKGLIDVLGLIKKRVNAKKSYIYFVRILIDELGNLPRTARFSIFCNEKNASNILNNRLKYINSVDDYNLFLQNILPKQ